MSEPTLEEIVEVIPHMELQDLRILESSVRVAIQMRTSYALSTDEENRRDLEGEGPGLGDRALEILQEPETYELTLADQALLAAAILSDSYNQSVFSSREIHTIIIEAGRPRIANITSAVNPLKNRSYLVEDHKELSLTPEGRAKARGLIGMLKRKAAA